MIILHLGDLWKGIETLLSSERDELQTFDLCSKVATLKQNQEPIEIYYTKLNTLWKDTKLNTLWKKINRHMPNPVKHEDKITIYNGYIQRQRVYHFLVGVNDTFYKER